MTDYTDYPEIQKLREEGRKAIEEAEQKLQEVLEKINTPIEKSKINIPIEPRTEKLNVPIEVYTGSADLYKKVKNKKS